jgi:thiol-disulfide isomerase/thioredoxin
VGTVRPGAPAPEPESCGIYSTDGIGDAPRPPTVSSAWYEGASGFRRAEDEQASSGAPLLALFYTDWCPHCRRFAAEVIPSPEMRGLGERIVKVKVNAEGSEEDRSLAKRLAVTSYPTLLVLASPGAPQQRVLHWSSPSVFVEACERALPNPARDHLANGIALARGGQAERSAAELRAAASDPRLAAEALDHLGGLALGASCFERAAAIYTRILAADASYGSGRARYLRGLALHRRGDGARAQEDAEEACRLGYGVACAVAERARPER